MLCNSQLALLLLLYVKVTQGIRRNESNVTISSGAGPFLNYARHCNGSFPKSSIFSPEGHHQLITAMGIKGIMTAWLPLRRRNLTEWTWLSGETMGPAISNPETAISGHDCAVLWKRDGMIVDNPCNHQFQQYICSSRIPCSTQVDNMELHCIEVSGEVYRIFAGKVSWFQAKQSCHDRNSTLASFEKKNYENIINKVKETEGLVDKTWIGLRLTDYVYQIPGIDKEDINFYMWQAEGPCVCPEYACAVIFNQNGTAKWRAELCLSSHHFICGENANPQSLTQINKKQDDLPTLQMAVIVISALAIFIIIVLVIIFCRRRFKKHQSKKSRNLTELPEEKLLHDVQQDGSDGSPSRMNETLLKEVKTLRNKIKEQIIPGKENKNIILIGLNGTGKSSLISSLITSLTPGPYRAVAEPGSFGETGRAITWFVEPYPLLEPLNKENIQQKNQIVLWDCPGFLDDNSESIVNLLLDIIRGKFLLTTRIADVADTAKYKKPEEYSNESNTCSKMDLIIFVHDCQSLVPEHLAAAVVKATRDSLDFKVPLLLVINKIDTVAEDPESLETTKNQVSKVLGLYGQVDRIFELSCYFADGKQKIIERSTKIDSYMCTLWKELLFRINYFGFEPI